MSFKMLLFVLFQYHMETKRRQLKACVERKYFNTYRIKWVKMSLKKMVSPNLNFIKKIILGFQAVSSIFVLIYEWRSLIF